MRAVIKHENKTPWGYHAIFMVEDGKGIGRVYWYDGETEVAIMDMLGVNEEYRKNGLGTTLQIIRENYALEKGFIKMTLYTDPGSWMYEWYKRRGYVYTEDKNDEDGNVWMEKQLIKTKK